MQINSTGNYQTNFRGQIRFNNLLRLTKDSRNVERLEGKSSLDARYIESITPISAICELQLLNYDDYNTMLRMVTGDTYFTNIKCENVQCYKARMTHDDNIIDAETEEIS